MSYGTSAIKGDITYIYISNLMWYVSFIEHGELASF